MSFPLCSTSLSLTAVQYTTVSMADTPMCHCSGQDEISSIMQRGETASSAVAEPIAMDLVHQELAGSREPVRLSLYHCSDPWYRPEETDVTPRLFHVAIAKGMIPEVCSFIRDRVSPSVLYDGISPLYRACKKGDIGIARLLLEKGASATQENDLSYRAASDKYWMDEHQLHKAMPMKAAVESGNIALINLLIEYGAPFDKPDSYGHTPLFLAVRFRDENMALFFIEKGAKIDIIDNDGSSLMSTAVNCEELRVVQELFKRGLSINVRDPAGDTLLHMAADRGNPAMLSFLLTNGARDSINELWYDTWSPLAWAVNVGRLENVKLLVEAGADLSLKCEGLDILQFARKKLEECESSYRSHPEFKEKGEIGNRRSVVDYLRQVFDKSCVCLSLGEDVGVQAEKDPMKSVSLSDGTELLYGLVRQTVLNIHSAIKSAGEGKGNLFFLRDLRDKAHNPDDWFPLPNPHCKSIEIMESNQLVNVLGCMYPHVRSIVKDCIVDEVGIIFEIPKSWS